MGNLRAVGIVFGLPAAFCAGAIALGCLAWTLKNGSAAEKLSVVLFCSLLFSPHTYWQDYSLAVVPALITSNRWVRYSILLPWYFFWPRQEMLPMIALSLLCMLIDVLRGVALRTQEGRNTPGVEALL
jgi:hypothetical protein